MFKTGLVGVLLALASCSCVHRGVQIVAQSVESPGAIEVRGIDETSLLRPEATMAWRVNEGDRTLLLVIDSPGGSLSAGMSFIRRTEQLKKRYGVKIKCVVDTLAASMGFAVLQSVCDERLMTKRAVLMTHNGRVSGQGSSQEMTEAERFLSAANVALAEVCAARLKMSLDAYRNKIANGSWAMAWVEAMEVGAVDGIIDPSQIPPGY